MRKLIEIKLKNTKRIRFQYLMTTACPYACSYCPDELHTGSNQKIDLEELEIFFNKFSDREISVNITGGECTLHPQFNDVIALAKRLDIRVLIDTNSVRTKRFYQEVADQVDVWNVTLHPSQHTLDLEKIQVLTGTSLVIVYIMMDPDHWATAIDWWNQCTTQLTDVKVIPLRAISNWAGAKCEVDYTSEQLDFMLQNPNRELFTDAKKQQLGQTHHWLLGNDAVARYNDDSTDTLDPYMLIKTDQNKFQGWQCLAGNETMNIKYDGTAGWANCGIKQYTNLRYFDPKELLQPVTCDRASCNCGTDIRSTKYV